MRRVLAGAAVLGGVLGVPSRADAHMMSTGLGPLYDGLAHLFVSPEDLLPVIALALLAGLRGAAAGRAVLFSLTAAWLAGGAASALVSLPALPPAAGAAVTVALGAMVAADAKLPRGVLAGAAAVLGLTIGAGSSLAHVPLGVAALFAIGGTASSFVVAALVAGQVATVDAPAGRVAVRVAGSWIAAIGLLMLGWALR